jgi:uncharacterized RDD family membrane protein YckC
VPDNQPDHGRGGVFCLNCGTVNDGNARFCTRCGFQLARRNTDPTSAVPYPSQVAPTPPEYVGFWIRASATVIDVLAVGVIVGLVSGVLDACTGLQPNQLGAAQAWLALGVYLVVNLTMRGESPGKKVLGIRVVDAQGNSLGFWRTVLREFPGKYLSGLFLGLGFLWVAWDRHKRGWHDYLSRSYVVRKPVQEVVN